MKPYDKFKTIVFTLTTAFLFFCWILIHPFIEEAPLLGVFFGGLISFGSYRLILNLCQLVLLKSTFLKKKVLGNTYLEGTWVGCYIGLDGTPKFYIENFEQTLDELIIRGRSYEADNSFKGTWVSENVIINEKDGIMRYTYETDMLNNTHKNQGIAIFNFIRSEKKSSPKRLIGYSSDIFNTSKIKSMLQKVDDKNNLDDNALLQKAHEMFEKNKEHFGL